MSEGACPGGLQPPGQRAELGLEVSKMRPGWMWRGCGYCPGVRAVGWGEQSRRRGYVPAGNAPDCSEAREQTLTHVRDGSSF